jgi:hypothetical protein
VRRLSTLIACCACLWTLPGKAADAGTPAAAPAKPTAEAMPLIEDPAFALPPSTDRESLAALSPSGVLLSVRIGPSFPQLYNKLTTNFLVQTDVAYQLPWRDRALGVFFGLGYTQPGLTGVQKDSRLDTPGGADAYSLTVRDLGFSLGVQYLLALPKRFILYAGLGVELHLTRSTLKHTAGTMDLGYTYEDSTRVGPLVRLGAAYPVGPGLIGLELRQEYTGVDHVLTGVNNTALLAAQVGYTFKL